MSHKSAEYWIEKYKTRQAYWVHDDNPKRPHALLTSGLHSNGFFNSRPVVADDDLLREIAVDLVVRLEEYYSIGRVGCVVGPQTGATKLAQYVSERITRLRGVWRPCDWASPRKTGGGSERAMTFEGESRKPLREQNVFFVEDVLTTGGSVDLTLDAVRGEGAIPLFWIGCIVNRSGLKDFMGRKILANLEVSMQTWRSEECPLCLVGSEAVRPKENWALLNAEY